MDTKHWDGKEKIYSGELLARNRVFKTRRSWGKRKERDVRKALTYWNCQIENKIKKIYLRQKDLNKRAF